MTNKIGKNVLIVRADNMGDLIMSGPAIRAVKESFGARITVLTSGMAAPIVPLMPEIDDTIVFDLPWVKLATVADSNSISVLVNKLKEYHFDAAFIFTVFSQNPLPAAMIAYMAGIPVRLAYCRENPYALLTHWLPDKEPYDFIQHQVERDLALVNFIGATTNDLRLSVTVPQVLENQVTEKLTAVGISVNQPWIILHAGVSELKRQYPFQRWVSVAKSLINEQGYQVLFTGSQSESKLCTELAAAVGAGAFAVGGHFKLDEFVTLIKMAGLTISVNTGTVHIAAAVGTPVVVLYAQTNPQHAPWMVPNRVLEFPVPADSQSKNEVIRHLYKSTYQTPATMPEAADVVAAIDDLSKTVKF